MANVDGVHANSRAAAANRGAKVDRDVTESLRELTNVVEIGARNGTRFSSPC